jgi:hypothetical protein
VTLADGDDGIVSLGGVGSFAPWVGWWDDDGVIHAQVVIGGTLGEVGWASAGWFADFVDWLTELVTTFSELADDELFVDWGMGEGFKIGETATDEVGVSPVEEGECTISILSAGRVGVVGDEGNWGGGVAGSPVVESFIPVSIRVGVAASGDENELFNDVSSVFTSSGVR